MRIDKFLKLSRIIKQRETVKNFCKNGYIRLNGNLVKPSKEIKVGDIIEIDTPLKYVKIKVKVIPNTKNVSKKEASKLYELIEEKRKDKIKEILSQTEDEFFKEF